MAAWFLFMALPLMAQEPPVAAQAPTEKFDELPVVIVHGYATPQMWKISKDGHVLWLVVIGKRAPAGAQWRSKQLEARVAESQLVLYPANSYGIGEGGMLRYLFTGKRLPGKSTLKDVLPPETYARWRVLKTAYIGSGDAVEHECPSCAMEELEQKVWKTMPPPGPALRPLLDDAAKKYKVKVRTMPSVTRWVELTQAEEKMAHMEYVLELGDVKCFAQRLDYLERLIRYRDQQANATTRDTAARPTRENCFTDWLASGKFTDPAAAKSMSEKTSLQWQRAVQERDAEWWAAALAALAENKSTFAGLWSDSELNGFIGQFRQLGYEVEEPGSGGD